MMARIPSLSKFEIVEGGIEKREQFYLQIFQHLNVPLYTVDSAGYITFYNEGAALLWGCKPKLGKDRWCGANKMYQINGEPLPHEFSPMANAIKEALILPAQEIIIEQPNGTRRQIISWPQPIFDIEGKLMGGVNTLEDITDRKNTEEELREKNKFWEILNHIGKTISSKLDLNNVVQAITDAATKISGAQFGAFFYNVINKNGEFYTLYTISGVPKEAFEKFPMPRNTKIFAPTFHGSGILRSDDITKDPRYGKNYPYHGMPKGHLPVKSYLAVPVISRMGKVIGALFFGHSDPGIFTQKTEDLVTSFSAQASIAMDNSMLYESSKNNQEKLAKINEELNKKNEELQKINIDLDNFIYTASHDLKAPVNNIEGLINVLSDTLKNGNSTQENINSIFQMMNQSIHQFSKTINDLTTITKIQKDIDEDIPEKINLHELIEDIKLLNGDLIANTGARIIYDPENLSDISFSRKNLKSILYNLITNAIKYRSPDRVPEIYIFTETTDNYIILCVQDNGLGLEEKKLQKLFSMFKRFHDHVDGTGIGLYLVKRIITNAGGKVEVESQVNKGSTFKVYFNKFINK